LLKAGREKQAGGAALWVVGLIIALALAIASPLASAYPDGLEWVAEQRGFLDAAQGPAYEIIPDYVLPGVPNEALATILAGIIGTLLVFGIAAAVAYSRRNRKAVQS
jgi:ABC-type Fe3+ transport system permease subunit